MSRPYQARQEELVRAINEAVSGRPHIPKPTLWKIRETLLKEQLRTQNPTLAFVVGCRIVGREDLLEGKIEF